MPDDPSLLPTALYQVLDGRVHVLTTYLDGSTARGEVPLAQLEGLLNGAVDGWYNVAKRYLGERLPHRSPRSAVPCMRGGPQRAGPFNLWAWVIRALDQESVYILLIRLLIHDMQNSMAQSVC